MSVRLYMDDHVPAAITQGLRSRGVDGLTSYEDGTAEFDDPPVLARATELGRVVFSQDADFLVITNQWLKTGREFSGLVYVHQLRLTIGQAIQDLTLIAQVLDPEDMRNRIQYLPL